MSKYADGTAKYQQSHFDQGLEAVQVDSNFECADGKQVVPEDGLQPNLEEKQYIPPNGHGDKFLHQTIDYPNPPPRRRKGLWLFVAIFTFIVVITIAVPTGVVVSRNKRGKDGEVSSSNSSSVPAANDIPVNATIFPSAITSETQGKVVTGTRLTTMDSRTGGDIYLFYQWDDRSLRYISQSSERVWQGSTDLHVTDAKTATPLASVSTSSNGSTFWWLFYVDTANVIQNMYSEKDATIWHKGNVGSEGYKVPSETNIAFTVSRGKQYNETIKNLGGGMSLYASGDDGVIHEYLFDDQHGTWSNGFTFPNTDGHSGASTWSEDTSAFIFTVSSGSGNSLELWYRDYNNTSDNPNNVWQLGPSSPASLALNGGMCGQYGIAYQASSGLIQGSDFSGFGDPTQTNWTTTYNITNQAAIEYSAVSCWCFFSNKNADRDIMFQVFYQAEGNGIMEAVRTWGQDNKTVPGI